MFLDYGVLGSLGAIRPTRRFVMGCRESLRFRRGGGALGLGMRARSGHGIVKMKTEHLTSDCVTWCERTICLRVFFRVCHVH